MPTTRLVPIRFVHNIGASAAFYRILGLTGPETGGEESWREVGGVQGGLGLHVADAEVDTAGPSAVGLQFTTSDAPDDLRDAFEAAGHKPSAIHQADFGSFFTVRDPDGYTV